MTRVVARERYGDVLETGDGTLRYRVTRCCGTTARHAFLGGSVARPVCRGCGRVLPAEFGTPVPQRPGAPCTCVPMPEGWGIVPGRSTCGQHGDHVTGERA